jgi:hypothetical protein
MINVRKEDPISRWISQQQQDNWAMVKFVVAGFVVLSGLCLAIYLIGLPL